MGTRVLYLCDSCGAEHRSGDDGPVGVPAHWASVYVHENREEDDAPVAPSTSLLFCEKCAPRRLAALKDATLTPPQQTREERALMSELFIILDHAVSNGQGSVLFGAGVSLSAEKGLVLSIRGGSVYRLHVEKVSP